MTDTSWCRDLAATCRAPRNGWLALLLFAACFVSEVSAAESGRVSDFYSSQLSHFTASLDRIEIEGVDSPIFDEALPEIVAYLKDGTPISQETAKKLEEFTLATKTAWKRRLPVLLVDAGIWQTVGDVPEGADWVLEYHASVLITLRHGDPEARENVLQIAREQVSRLQQHEFKYDRIEVLHWLSLFTVGKPILLAEDFSETADIWSGLFAYPGFGWPDDDGEGFAHEGHYFLKRLSAFRGAPLNEALVRWIEDIGTRHIQRFASHAEVSHEQTFVPLVRDMAETYLLVNDNSPESIAALEAIVPKWRSGRAPYELVAKADFDKLVRLHAWLRRDITTIETTPEQDERMAYSYQLQKVFPAVWAKSELDGCIGALEQAIAEARKLSAAPDPARGMSLWGGE